MVESCAPGIISTMIIGQKVHFENSQTHLFTVKPKVRAHFFNCTKKSKILIIQFTKLRFLKIELISLCNIMLNLMIISYTYTQKFTNIIVQYIQLKV